MRNKIISTIFAVALIFTFVSMTESANATEVGLGTDQVDRNDTVYFGNADYSSTNYPGVSGPIKWIVINKGTSSYLVSADILETGKYNNEPGYVYPVSPLSRWCESFLNSGTFSDDEKNSIQLTSTTDSTDTYVNNIRFKWYTCDKDDRFKIFIPSANEVNRSQYFNADTRKASYQGVNHSWWLRSQVDTTGYAFWSVGNVDANGTIGQLTCSSVSGIRPALNLINQNVSFTTDTSSIKSSFGYVDNGQCSEWKLTLARNEPSFAGGVTVDKTAVRNTDTIKVNHPALNALQNEYTNVTAMLVDEDGKVKAYGSINESQTDTESTLTIPENLAPGEYSLRIYAEKWNGQYETDYSVKKPFTTTITVGDVSNCSVDLEYDQIEFSGERKTPEATVKYDGEELIENTDYEVNYEDNYAAGTATVIVEGIGKYYGSVSKTFTISKRSLENVNFNASGTFTNKKFTYTGKPITIENYLGAKDGDHWLIYDGEFTIKYTNNIQAGQATVEFTGAANYYGTVIKTFTIHKAPLEVSVEDTSRLYHEDNPEFTVAYRGFVNNDTVNKQIKGTPSFTTDATKESNVGTYDVIASGLSSNNYEITYVPGKLEIGKRPVPVNANNYVGIYDGEDHSINVNSDEPSSIQYSVGSGNGYSSNRPTLRDVGNLTVSYKVIPDSENYSAVEGQASIIVNPAPISSITIDAEVFEYDGEPKIPGCEVYCNNNLLIEGIDYTISLSDNVEPGRATISATGKGNYTGTVSKYFEIKDSDGKFRLKEVHLSNSMTITHTNGYALRVVVPSQEMFFSCKLYSDGTLIASDNGGKSTWTIPEDTLFCKHNYTLQYTYGNMIQVKVYKQGQGWVYEKQRDTANQQYGSCEIEVEHVWPPLMTTDREATCTTDGQKSIKCLFCSEVLPGSERVIPAKGHSWKTPSYKWASNYYWAEAETTCKHDRKHVIKERVVATQRSNVSATVSKVYIAVFSNPIFTPQVKTIYKKAQPMTVKAKVKTVKFKTLKKKAQIVAPLSVRKAQGKVSYKVVSGNAKSKKALKLNTKTGKITVKKGTRKGTYSLKVKVLAAGNSAYKAGSKTVTIKIKAK